MPGDAADCACCGPAARAATARLTAEMSRRGFLAGLAAIAPAAAGAQAPSDAPQRPILLTNIRLFDGTERRLREGVAVLVRGNRIEGLPRRGEPVAEAQVMDCGGRLLMPGLIDAHWHALMCALPQVVLLTADVAFVHLVAAREAERTLMRGFTTTRDAAGPAFVRKRAIDGGLFPGPRIHPSGAMISQTSGHGDFRLRHEVPRQRPAYTEMQGVGAIADGEAEVLRSVREQLLLGATQIRLAGGGGIASDYDPIDVVQFTEAELRAAVAAASDWGTYVMIHVYTPVGIQRAIRAGVHCIKHGQLADAESARMMVGEGTWWSLQPFLADEDANERATPEAAAKGREVARGTVNAFEMVKRFNLKMAWGTDILFSPQLLPFQGRQLAKMTRFFDPLEILSIATARNGELLRMSGPRDPHGGPLGVIAPSALADILVADGDPTRRLDFFMNPSETLRVIIKDGRLHKNTL
ncbi:amidohydrolase family protein [Roseomonas sp. CCTCC AB2023176]|uniref:amidohydrolase family protein n=1 Tax=Roseomonas sp. CCTCC AB2023176 TaxID=3342640 RepID=UPI0035D8F62C